MRVGVRVCVGVGVCACVCMHVPGCVTACVRLVRDCDCCGACTSLGILAEVRGRRR